MTEHRHVIGRSAPGDREPADSRDERDAEEQEEDSDRGLDKTLADSFPASDPPSSSPGADGEEADDDPFAGD